MGVTQSTPTPEAAPAPAPAPPSKPAAKPVEQRCIACLNYHYHDHPSVLAPGANFQSRAYDALSPREKFEGILIDNTPEWYGRLVFRSGAVYEGGFRSGEFHGFGHYVAGELYEYIGGFKEGKKEGFGQEVCVNQWGAREEYVGGWKEDKRHGDGWINGRDWMRYYMGNALTTTG